MQCLPLQDQPPVLLCPRWMGRSFPLQGCGILLFQELPVTGSKAPAPGTPKPLPVRVTPQSPPFSLASKDGPNSTGQITLNSFQQQISLWEGKA